jgi:hypothetical protein
LNMFGSAVRGDLAGASSIYGTYVDAVMPSAENNNLAADNNELAADDINGRMLAQLNINAPVGDNIDARAGNASNAFNASADSAKSLKASVAQWYSQNSQNIARILIHGSTAITSLALLYIFTITAATTTTAISTVVTQLVVPGAGFLFAVLKFWLEAIGRTYFPSYVPSEVESGLLGAASNSALGLFQRVVARLSVAAVVIIGMYYLFGALLSRVLRSVFSAN